MKKIVFFAVAVVVAALVSFAADTTSSAPKSFQIRNLKFGQVLRPENANNADGTPIVLYPAQPWKCMTWKLLPVGDSAFQLQNHFTHKTFAGRTNETRLAVVQVPFDRESLKRPSWKVTKLSNGFYRIIDASGESLTASSKQAVILAPWEEKPEQQWELIETDPAQLTM